MAYTLGILEYYEVDTCINLQFCWPILSPGPFTYQFSFISLGHSLHHITLHYITDLHIHHGAFCSLRNMYTYDLDLHPSCIFDHNHHYCSYMHPHLKYIKYKSNENNPLDASMYGATAARCKDFFYAV